jgi:hypothetical protein
MYVLYTFISKLRSIKVDRRCLQICKRMVGLAEKCMHPASNKPYVKSYGGGRDNSPEGHQVVVYPLEAKRLHDLTDGRQLGRILAWLHLRV